MAWLIELNTLKIEKKLKVENNESKKKLIFSFNAYLKNIWGKNSSNPAFQVIGEHLSYIDSHYRANLTQNILQLLGISVQILIPQVTPFFRSKWLIFSFSAHLRNIWCSCRAKEAKRIARAIISPPITAVSLVLFRLQRATTRGAAPRDTAKLVEPTQPVGKIYPEFSFLKVHKNAIYSMHEERQTITEWNQDSLETNIYIVFFYQFNKICVNTSRVFLF